MLEFGAALLLGILVIVFAPKFGPVTLVGVGALFATVLIGTSWYFYTQHRLLIDFTYPLLSTTAIYLTLIFTSFVREQAQRRQIRSAFGQYLSPALVEQLAQVAGKTQARRRRARDDHHVLRRPGFHHHLGILQA